MVALLITKNTQTHWEFRVDTGDIICSENFVPAGILLVFAFALNGAAKTDELANNNAINITNILFFIKLFSLLTLILTNFS